MGKKKQIIEELSGALKIAQNRKQSVLWKNMALIKEAEERAVELDSLRRDHADLVRQRDAAQKELDRLDGQRHLQDAATALAKEREAIDGINAGLVPVDLLRKALREYHNGRLTLTFDRSKALEKAVYEAITAPSKPKISFSSGTISFFPAGATPPSVPDFSKGGYVVSKPGGTAFNVGDDVRVQKISPAPDRASHYFGASDPRLAGGFAA